jgi:hypothetical protein
MKTISAAFVKAKRSFGPALKDKTNPAFRSKYADLGACLEAVEDALLENGIALLQETFEDPSGVTVETVFLHESGEERRCGKLHVPASKQDPQGYGSALTYARRYSLMAACGIAPEDDDGNAASKPVKTAAPRIPATAKADESGMTPERRKQIDSAAACAIEAFGKGNEVAAYEVVSDIQETEEKLYLWNILHLHSALRASLKKMAQADKTPITA